ncbi:N-acetylmuramic acid 6-phosphate etherase [Paenibacillus ginsengarvi]|uniref:N-acetylmuramic acid 6-phosphate etherase n=1 Tax=Paenibacillus ginsengarvi TaxID=400777 RepID=A0A3B0CKQ8_9BACL|nr:N-acetylmuramic acid 6-phosphate etherase [Paenibacillus ginsengarvi]RKN85812.1 N-acetylmuramic acid 6-phosphate etherase [Paenibacillus ginsengarvi]
MQADSSIRALDTEQVNPRTRHLDSCSTLELLQLMNAEDFRVPAAVAEALPAVAEAVELIAASLRAGGRLFYVGAGTSGRLGMLDAYECPPTFGTAPELVQALVAGGVARDRADESAEDDPELGAADLAGRGLAPGDVVVGIAASGRTPYVVGALRCARSAGAHTVALACCRGSAIGALADRAIEVAVGPEALTGSTRLKAGTAQKLVLNMISTATMVRLGKAYGNFMVDMQPSNGKLRQRARGIVAMATGADEAAVEAAMSATGEQMKASIVMLLAGVSAEEAFRRLDQAGGIVREALRG